MDLSPSVPSNPSLLFPRSTLLSWGVFVWHEFRVFVMGALPATLFLLSVWHFRWTRPWLYLRSSSLITMCIILLSPSAPWMHTSLEFAFSLLRLPLSLKKRTCPPHLLIFFLLPSIVVIVSKEENQYPLSQEGMTHFSWLCLLPIYFSRVTLQLPSSSFPLLSLCSLLSSPVRSASVCFLFCSFPLCLHMCGERKGGEGKKKSSLGATLPLSCEDQWWH